MIDSKGLVCKSRLRELQHHKVNFAHDIGDNEWIYEGLSLPTRREGFLLRAFPRVHLHSSLR